MAEKQLIASTIPLSMMKPGSPFNFMLTKYDILNWTEVESKPEQFGQKVEVILIGAQSPAHLDEDLIKNMPNLRALVSIGTGVSHIDLPLLKKWNIPVACTPGRVMANATADMGMALMLAAARRIPENMQVARSFGEGKMWDLSANLKNLGQRDVTGMTLGILGLGHIGFEVARRAQGFRMKVLYHKRSRRADDAEVGATYCSSLEELLAEVDYLMIAVPGTPDTKGMMGKEQFKLMKPTSILINIARGSIVNTDDLVEALQSKTIGGAAMDVTDPEPLLDTHPLHALPNVIVTAHSAVFTPATLNCCFQTAVEQVQAAMEGRKIPDEICLDDVSPSVK